jgi:aspartyl-tRNA(Asn)/glutamyl-tRNA(Gln) amidotransferase subunit C
MSISLDEVRHVARLARLQLDETEILSFQTELNSLIGHFADIQTMDVAGIEPKSHALAIQNVWAFDEPWQPVSRDQAIKNAPVSRAGLFVVPMIIEE